MHNLCGGANRDFRLDNDGCGKVHIRQLRLPCKLDIHINSVNCSVVLFQ
jgi:hypothetical protein